MTTAFVLSGGASLGSIQVGMVRALARHGITPDLLIGTSAGAINAAVLSQGVDEARIDELAEIWVGLNRSAVFPVDPLRSFLGIIGRRNHLCSPHPLRKLLERHLSFARLEDARIPLHAVAVDAHTGEEVLLSRGPTVDCVVASASVPGVFPPVAVADRMLIDGGVANNAPLSHAVQMGADTVYLLACGHACALAAPPKSALGVVLQSMSVMIGRQLVHDIDRFETSCHLHVVPPLCPLDVSPIDFGKARALMARSYESTAAWLAGPRSNKAQAARLAPHHHR